MKKLIFLFTFLGASVMSYGQGFDFGLRAGGNFPGMNVRDFEDNSTFEELKSFERTWGFHAGLYAKIDILVLYLEPQALFTNLNHQLVATTSSGEEQDINFSVNRLDFPLLVGKSLGPLRLFAGPIYSVNYSNSDEIDLKDGTLGYQAGVGLQLSNFIIDLKYEGAFSNTASQVIINNTEYHTDLRTDQLIVSLGFAIF